jgi:hypothetical protein
MGYKPKKPIKPKYVYTMHENELKFKVFMNPDKEEYARIKQTVVDNNGYCPCKIERTPATKCMCEEFMNKNREGWCECKLFKKVKRTTDELEAFSKGIEFDDDKDNARAKRAEEAEAKKNPALKLDDEE